MDMKKDYYEEFLKMHAKCSELTGYLSSLAKHHPDMPNNIKKSIFEALIEIYQEFDKSELEQTWINEWSQNLEIENTVG